MQASALVQMENSLHAGFPLDSELAFKEQRKMLNEKLENAILIRLGLDTSLGNSDDSENDGSEPHLPRLDSSRVALSGRSPPCVVLDDSDQLDDAPNIDLFGVGFLGGTPGE